MTKSKLPDPKLFSHLQWKPGMQVMDWGSPTTGRLETKIEYFDGSWRLNPVELRGKLYTYELKNGFLEDSKEKSLLEWTDFATNANQKNQHVPMACDVLFSILHFLEPYLDNPHYGDYAKGAWTYLAGIFSGRTGNVHSPILLSKCVYSGLSNADIAEHDIGLTSVTSNQGSLIGQSGPLYSRSPPSYTSEFCRLVFGYSNPERISYLFEKLTGLKPHLFRVTTHSLPSREFGLILQPDNVQNTLAINAIASVTQPGPAIGVKQYWQRV